MRRDDLLAMSRSLAHRGPDDQGVLTDGNVGLCFRRLAIQDLTPSGHQPMVSPCGRYAIVFNGEIYNFLEIRRELTEKDHVFRSSGDTEVLLHAFMEWGPACVRRLNGMWSFAVLDRRTRQLTACRDHFGIKPLFLYRNQDVIALASEPKAILASDHCDATINYRAVANYVHYGELDTATDTFWEGIEAVPPATIVQIDLATGSESRSCYWSVTTVSAHDGCTPEEFAELFEESVALRMRSDVPVGVFLSGGLDSTSILCSLARQRGAQTPPKAYAFMAEGYDESAYINATVARTGAELVPLSTSATDVWDAMVEMLRFQDEPVHSPAAIIGFLLSRAAAKDGTKVILNGQGADETLAGYPPYFSNLRQSLMEAGNFPDLYRQISRYASETGVSSRELIVETLRLFVQSRLRYFRPYRRIAAARAGRALMNNAWFTDTLLSHARAPDTRYQPQDLQSALHRSITRDPLPLYLRIEDRNSMAHSIEVRLPFLDHRLVERALSTRPQEKLSGAYNKQLLREAMRGHIPENVRTRRDKMGFPVPFGEWFRNEWYAAAGDILNSRECRERGVVNVDYALEALVAHRRGERDHAQSLFDVVQVELWLSQLHRPEAMSDQAHAESTSARS